MTEDNSKFELPDSNFGIYVHIPFCRHKCPYCDFVSGVVDSQTRKEHLEMLTREIEQSRWKASRAGTLFLGGGTPSYLEHEEMSGLLQTLRSNFDLRPAVERTLEANPGTLDSHKLERFLELEFNRLSLGVQSLNNRLLRTLGRTHTAEQALQAYRSARAAGFENINLDAMFGIPGQSLSEWRTDLESVLELRPEHISLYSLTIEPDTEFFRSVQSGLLCPPKEGLSADMFESAMDLAGVAGYRQYEISNYALPGRECLHNQIYWRNAPYLGFGLGASSFVDGVRWKNFSTYEEYAAAVARSEMPVAEREHLEGREALGEAIMLALRTDEGADLTQLGQEHDLDATEVYSAVLEHLQDTGLVSQQEGLIRLSRKGILLADYVCMQFLE